MRFIAKFLLVILGSGVGLYAARFFLSEVSWVLQFPSVLYAPVAFGLLQLIIRPILKLLFGPIILLTLGLFTFFIQVIFVFVVDVFDTTLSVEGFTALFVTAFLVSAGQIILKWFLPKKDDD